MEKAFSGTFHVGCPNIVFAVCTVFGHTLFPLTCPQLSLGKTEESARGDGAFRP